MRSFATAALLVAALGTASGARGQDRDSFASALSRASEALKRGEFSRAAAVAGTLAREVGPARPPELEADETAPVARADRAEAWRIWGLALFFEGQRPEAEKALVEYMKLEEDAHLDPALVPPDAIVFFEDVRSRHAAEIRAYHPDPEKRRWLLLNLAPPAGQFQNDDAGKGWAITASGTALIGLNLGSYALLRSWCGEGNVCGAEGGDRYGEARALRAVNMASLVGLGAVYVYGVVDGFVGYRGGPREFSISLAPGGHPGLSLGGRF